MSTRYSLRQTPRKKELFDGMVETPGRRVSTRRKSQFPIESDGESSSAQESSSNVAKPAVKTRGSLRRRGTAKFIEHLDEEEEDASQRSTPPTTPEDIKMQRLNAAKANGNGVANGKTNGSANGHASGHANGHVEEESKKAAKDAIVDGWAPGLDPKVDYSGEYEFGGPWFVSLMMIGFPILMWYMWIGAEYYNGKFPLPAEGQSLKEFGARLVNLVYTGAFPHAKAWAIYWTFFIFEGACYCLLPGIWAYGKPLAFASGKQLKYYCSAYASFYTTIVVVTALNFTGIFRLSTIVDEFGSLMSVAIISGFLVSIAAYISAFARGATHRMTGNHVYDFFMGAELNPRLFGILDFKMFFEVRLPWYILFLLSLGTAFKQWETYGYVTGEVGFLLMAHYLYANACSKGEQLIVTTWDMYYEKWGFMLIFWNLAGVPLSYCHCTIYLAKHHPDEYRHNPYILALMYAGYLFVYWVWDTCNSQKNGFRAIERGKLVKRNTFPQLPWQIVENPRTIKTGLGDNILADGWYGLARKVHYTCDVYFSTNWGLITGFASPFPWFYPIFFTTMIAHRAWRDITRCRQKYGDAWLEYEKTVPYLFIPYVI